MAFKGKWHRTETRRILRKCDGNTTDEKCAHLAKSIQQTIIQMDREPDVYKVSERMDANTRKIRQIASTSVISLATCIGMSRYFYETNLCSSVC